MHGDVESHRMQISEENCEDLSFKEKDWSLWTLEYCISRVSMVRWKVSSACETYNAMKCHTTATLGMF